MSKKTLETRVSQLEDFLRKHPYGVNKEDIIDTIFYSYRHANRLFSSKNGESIKSFINRIRLQKAAEYLSFSSKSIFDIAVEVGYESSASFSKMFKKVYNMSPTEYRESTKKEASIQLNKEPLYFLSEFDHKNLKAKKVIFDPNITFDEFYLLIKNTYKGIEVENKDFMILWDEDPQTNQSNTSRCFIAFKEINTPELNDSLPTIERKYAHFNTSIFKQLDYPDWHKIAFQVLVDEKIEMRESTYIEHFHHQSLTASDHFFPYRISTAIE